MIKTITKVGNSQGIIFDAALLEMAHLKAGDNVNVEVHEGGTLTLTPIRPRPSREEVSKVIKATMKDYARMLFREHHHPGRVTQMMLVVARLWHFMHAVVNDQPAMAGKDGRSVAADFEHLPRRYRSR